MDKTHETISENYLDLVKEYPLIPIRSKASAVAAQNRINSILDRTGGCLNQEQLSYIDTLSVLLDEYDRKEESITDIHGIDLLKVLMKQKGLRQKELVSIFKTESIVSEVLSGQRNLTVEHIRKLADYFKVSPSAFFPR